MALQLLAGQVLQTLFQVAACLNSSVKRRMIVIRLLRMQQGLRVLDHQDMLARPYCCAGQASCCGGGCYREGIKSIR